MGAHQSTSGSPSSLKCIPIRPRTPLRFGSVPTALPVDPAHYNTRPIRNLHANFVSTDPITSILSQENYLHPRTYSPAPSDDDMPSPASVTSSLSDFAPTRYLCPHHTCPYAVIGFYRPDELDMHLHTVSHYSKPMQLDCAPQWLEEQAAGVPHHLD